jgi:putative PIN family toxin of toxin-antitoxin system
MRVVVDTNIFISLLIRPGTALSAFVDYLDRHGTILYSAETLTELVDVMRRRKFSAYTTSEDVAAFVRWVIATGELVAVEHVAALSRDPKDDKFLAVAVAGHADYLISGDKDLLVLEKVGPVPIVSPAAFLASVKH